MIKVEKEFEGTAEAKVFLSAMDYWGSLYELDEWLRNECKHGNISEDRWEAFDDTRTKIREIMESNGVNLLDVE